MANSQITLVLTGPNAGATLSLNGRRFVDGKLTLHGDPVNLQGPIRYFGRAYEAYPEGSEELAEAQARDGQEPDNGDSGKGQQGDSTQSKDAGKTADNGDSGKSHQGDLTQSDSALARAIRSLNPDNDEHWTQQGLPSMKAVEEAYGDTGVTRAQVSDALPDFDREVAREDKLAQL